jgi:hypothetical protein
MSTETIVKSVISNDLDTAKAAVFQALSEKATEALLARKQEVATQYFTPKAE